MIHQQYILSEKASIFLVERIPNKSYDWVTILMPGFSQSVSDRNYFYNELSDELLKNGSATVLFEPFGHGDSFGELFELELDTVKNNIISILEYIKKNFHNKRICFICRGVYSNLFFIEELKNDVKLIIGINPVYMSKDEASLLLNNYNNYIDVNSCVKNDNSLLNLLIKMGAEKNNICGQIVKKQLLYDLLVLPEIINKDKFKFVLYNAKTDDFNVFNNITNNNCFIEFDFLASIESRYKLINIIKNLIFMDGEMNENSSTGKK